MSELFEKLEDDEEIKCIIFLDSIDQLAPDDAPFMMKWLPKQLPACVKIVISTLPEEKYKVLPNLKVRKYHEVDSLEESRNNRLLISLMYMNTPSG